MKAMIFAAGLGTRLKPYTQDMPKALVPVAGKPMLEHVIDRLKQSGVHEIVINVHHFPQQILDFLQSKQNFGIRIEISDESEALLSTGGGLQKAAWFFDDGQPFLVHNVDIISDVDFAQMYRFHQETASLATLAVSERNTSRYFLFDENHRLRGWKNKITGEVKPPSLDSRSLRELAFSGIHIISPAIFPKITETGKFGIPDVYLRLALENRISGFEHAAANWIDMGKAEELEQAEHLIRKLKRSF